MDFWTSKLHYSFTKGNGSPEEAGSNQQQQVPESTNIKPNEKFNYKKGAKSGLYQMRSSTPSKLYGLQHGYNWKVDQFLGKNSAETGGHSGGQKPQSNEGNLENPRNRNWKKKFNKKDKDGNQKQPDGSNKGGKKDEESQSPKESAKVSL